MIEIEAMPESCPVPTTALLEEEKCGIFVPAPDLMRWIRGTFIDGDGPLVNPAHEHLKEALIGCMWTNVPNRKNMLSIVGTAEVPMPKGGWSGKRGEFQLRRWFGMVPDFILTFFAPHFGELADDGDNVSQCAIFEHELYHCAQATDRFGAPKFRKDGAPVFGIRGHDVTEFVGVVERYGIDHVSNGRAFVDAANAAPLIAPSTCDRCCGTCGAAL